MALTDKVAVVTGSSRGIGKAVALELARQGADIVVCARTETQEGELPGTIHETAEAVRALGRRALAVKMDVTQQVDVQGMVDQALAEFGKIDILINNAGIISGPAFLEGDVETLDRFLAINVRGPYLGLRLVAPVMAAQGGGCIITVSSGAARLPQPPQAGQARRGGGTNTIYGVTKAAVDRLSAGVAQELFEQNVAVISLYPGFILTERLQLSQGSRDLSGAGSPDVPAQAVALLCHDPMAYTGQVVTARELVETSPSSTPS